MLSSSRAAQPRSRAQGAATSRGKRSAPSTPSARSGTGTGRSGSAGRQRAAATPPRSTRRRSSASAAPAVLASSSSSAGPAPASPSRSSHKPPVPRGSYRSPSPARRDVLPPSADGTSFSSSSSGRERGSRPHDMSQQIADAVVQRRRRQQAPSPSSESAAVRRSRAWDGDNGHSVSSGESSPSEGSSASSLSIM